ncbi:hypothetical protein NODU109028_02540 [Nocardioides dubius]|uniref:Pentapeptide repeat-containing protein n=1 Tax=Nocardioides dubius TaxID=317019 RepID=A0ABN1TQT9_9ACTN
MPIIDTAAFHSETFRMVHDKGGSQFRDLDVSDCTFDNCTLSGVTRPERMSRVSDVRLTDCSLVNSQLGPTVLEDVVVDGLQANALVLCWSFFLRRVRVRGRITSIKLNRAPAAMVSPAMQAAFDEARAAFYAETDWALDLTQARFVATCEIGGVPLDLVRIDPESQAVVRRVDLPEPDALAELREVAPWAHERITWFRDDVERDELLLVAPLAGKKARREEALAGIAHLRRLGVARPEPAR